MTTGRETACLANAFAVTAATPVIIQVNPNTGQQGQQNLPITITGQFSHFGTGSVITFSGTGITVGAPTAATLTSLTVPVTIAANAPLGAQGIQVVTGTETVTLSVAFTVTAGTPVLLLISPNTGFQGQTVLVGLTGQFTHFAQGSTRVSFGPGITVQSLTVADSAHITARINIGCSAGLGGSSVTVTTGAEVLTVNNGFTVLTTTGDLLAVSRQNASILQFDTTGNLLGPLVASRSGGLVEPINMVFGPDGNLYVADNGLAVRRYSGETGAFIDNFVVPTPGILTGYLAIAFGPDGNLYIADASAQVIRRYNGTTGAYLGVFSSGGNLLYPCDLVFGPDGNLYVVDEVNVVQFNGATGAYMSVFVPAGRGGQNVPEALRFGCDNSLYVGTSGVDFTGGLFRYDGTTGAFISPPIIPPSGVRNDGGLAFGPNNVLYDGTYHNSQPTDYVLRYNPQNGVVDTFIPPGVIGILNGLAFRASSGPPVLLSLSPNSGQPGLQNLSVSVVGRFTHFTNASVIDLGSGITASSMVATDSTHLTAQILIGANATIGSHDLTITTGGEIVRLVNSFTVTASTPVITQVNPNTGQQGQQNLPVTITGQFTHFSTGSVVTFTGSGVTAGVPTAATLTSLTMPVTMSANAPLGAQGIQVVTSAETVSLANVFTVTAGTPAITLVNPNLSVAITGLFTHFSQGVTTASFGAGITVISLTVSSAISATAVLNIDPAASGGNRWRGSMFSTAVVNFHRSENRRDLRYPRNVPKIRLASVWLISVMRIPAVL